MGKVKTTWLLPGHSGRPCHHEDIYTKMDKKTGKVYSVKLCNPSDVVTNNQTSQRTSFGSVASALSAWINQNKIATATDHAVYLQVKAAFDRQNKCSTLRGYMMTRNYAVAQTDGSVTITIGTYTTTVAAGVVSNGTGGGSNQGGGSNPTPTQRVLTLSVSPAGAGTVTGAGSYTQGTNANITATAATGYVFSKWSDNNTSATRNVTVNSDMTLIAQFTVAGSGGGDDDQGGNDDQGGGDAF